MPVQPLNFTNAPTSVSPLSAILPGIEEGLKMSSAMQQMKQHKQASDLATKLAELQIQAYPDKSTADLDNKKAMTGYYNAMSGAIPEKNDIAKMRNQLLLEVLKQKLNAPSSIDKANATADHKDELKSQSAVKSDFNKMIQEATGEAESSNNLQNYGTAFDTAYNKTPFYEKGSMFGGRNLGVGSAAQSADRNSAAMVAQISNLLKGTLTNQKLKFLQTLKPDRTLNPESEKNAISQITGGASRGAEHLPFIMYAQQKGMSPNDIRSLWAKYATEKPVYNAEKGIINKENLNSWKKYVDEFTQNGGAPVENNGYALGNDQVGHLANFLNQSGADTKAMGGAQKAASQVNVPQPAPGKIIIKDPNGQYHQIDKDKLADVKNKYKGINIEVVSGG